jgi:hypothetical protein
LNSLKVLVSGLKRIIIKIPFFNVAVLHSIPLLYGLLVANTIQFGPSFAEIKLFGNFTKTSKLI